MFDLVSMLGRKRERANYDDDIRVIRNWSEYENGRGKMKYLMYELEVDDGSTKVRLFKAVKVVRVYRLPKSAKQSESFMDMHAQVLTGVWETNVKMVTIIANMLTPEPLGLLFCYGVQGIAKTEEEAKRSSDIQFAQLVSALQGTYRTMMYHLLDYKELEWLREKMMTMKCLTVVRGIPKPKMGGVDAGPAMNNNNANPDGQDTTEELIAGMTQYEYVIEIVQNPVKVEDLEKWLTQTAREMTRWQKQLQGNSTINFSLSVPMMYMANLGASEGWSHSYTDASTVSNSQMEGFSATFSNSIGESMSESVGQTIGRTIGQTHTETYGFNHGNNVGSSLSDSWSNSVGQSVGSNVGFSENESHSNSVSESTSSSTGTSGSTTESSGWSSTTGTSHTVTDGTTDTTSHGGGTSWSNGWTNTTSNTTTDATQAWTETNSNSTSHNFGTQTSTNESSGWNFGGNVGGSTSAGVSLGVNANQSVNYGISGGISGSSGSSTTDLNNSGSSTDGTSTTQNHGFTTSAGSSSGTTGSSGGNTSWSSSHATSHSVSNGTSTSQGVSGSTSFSNGWNSSTSQSSGTGESWSSGSGQSWGQSASQTESAGYSTGAGSSTGESWGSSQSQSYGQTQSDSYSQSISQGHGTSWGQSRGVSQSAMYGQALGNSIGTAIGSTGTITQGTSSTMGLGPSIGYAKSHQWLDQEVQNILTLLDFQNMRLMKALNTKGAFYTDVYIATENEFAKAAVSILAKTAWHDDNAMMCPLQVLDLPPEEEAHLLYHFSAFSPDARKDSIDGQMYSYRYSTILTPDECTAYTHPPRISEGGVYADVEDVPKFARPSMMRGDIYMGHVLSSERWTMDDEMETPAEYRLPEDALMHGIFTGESRSGKTVAATRFISELSKVRRQKTGKRLRILAMDPKQDWRILAKLVEPERFHFYSMGNPEFHPINLNICKVPKNVDPRQWVDGIIEIFCRNYGLQERGKATCGESFYELYEEAGVFEDSPNWREFVPQRSAKVTMPKIFARMVKHKQDLEDPIKSHKGRAGNEQRDVYARVIDRLQPFGRKFSLETQLFGQEDGLAIDELIGADDVTVLESYGLETTFKNFIFGCITSGFFKYAQGHEGGFLAPDQYETVLVIEEANEVLVGSDKASSAGQGSSGFSGESEFEKILDQAAGLGLFIFSITQKIADMPSSVVANSGLLFAGKISREEDTKVVIRKIGREERLDNRDVLKWFPRSPIGWFVCRSSRNFNFLETEPVLVHIDPLNVSPPTNRELDALLAKKEAMELLHAN